MSSVKTCLTQKGKTVAVISVKPDDKVVVALQLMRDNRVRAILVIQDEKLMGIITQGDCAIKVLLPGLDAKQVLVQEVMTANPVSVKLDDPIEACTGLMASRNFRHLPVVEAGRVVGVISIGDVVKDNIRQMGQQIGFLETYIKGHSAAL
ncbi:CBS domain-containing protein [Limnohabitans sp.]|jgi:CBS domain-containing protein|uniref:CBS domain-containing protein n=1 Tax=Limnohabitans sp. TaxID=1907725 RepID=UPI0039BD1D5B|nr:CBS domain-containing protein [Comamonadaceae bacterium]